MNPNIPTKIVGKGGWDLEAEEVEVKISGSWRVWFLIEGAWKQLQARVKPARPTRTRASRKSSVWIIARAPVRTNFRWTLAKQLAPLLRRCVEDVARTGARHKTREWRLYGKNEWMTPIQVKKVQKTYYMETQQKRVKLFWPNSTAVEEVL